ncbi:MAG TPA: HU family DNA-binding protein [Caldithrix abyssi]|uniref:HU family DNA-binding protein n=1 Tax=Caldithrix abyssi TaxID=187145 RepID=A0A7V1LM76_CALAY|nr:HU family DNA-binding protein [Caldithrix abyssi]
MNTREVLKRISQRMNRPEKETRTLYRHSVGVITDHLANQKSFTIPQLGTFGTVERKERQGYNPHHKKKMSIPRKMVAFFKPARAFKEAVQ